MIAIFNKISLLLLLTGATKGIDPVDLGTAGDFAILAKTGISTVPASTITGDIGVSPIAATAMTGFSLTLASDGKYSTSDQVTGKCYAANYAVPTPVKMTTAVSDMETAYENARNATNSDAARINLNDGQLGGLTLTAGVYTFQSDISISADVVLDGLVNDVFIIQTTGALIQDAGTEVHLVGGVIANNVFWQVAGNVAVRSTAVMQGILLVKTDADFATGSELIGSVLAQTACTLDMAKITKQ
jgi:hypothetical protein